MTTITKESLTDKIALLELIQRDDYITQEELFQLEAYRMLLAGMEQEPVYQFVYNNPHEEGYTEWLDCNEEYYKGVPADCRRVLYAAPQPLTDAERAEMEQCRKAANSLVMLVKRLGYSLRSARPDSKLPGEAMEYLRKHKLVSVEDILR